MDGETDEVYFEEIFFYQSNNDSLICLSMPSKPIDVIILLSL